MRSDATPTLSDVGSLSRLAAAIGALSLLAASIGAAGDAKISAADDAGLRAGTFSPPRAAPEFSLRGSDGAELTLGRFRGKVVILGFGFTSCPNVCPVTLAVLAEARKQLGAEADALQIVYITVDPERDDAERMRKYLGAFDSTFIGGTGSADELAAVRQRYGISATREDFGASYGFSHSSYTYLIDREGNLRGLMPYGHSADDYVNDVKILLKQ